MKMIELKKTNKDFKIYQSKYEYFRAGALKSYVRRDPFEIMQGFFGTRYARYRKLWAKANDGFFVAELFPMHIDIDLQDACNLQCSMCHQEYRPRTGNIIRRKTLKAIIDEGSSNGLCAINFGASGEPLLQKDLLLDSVKYACNKNIMDIFVHTNGILLDEKFGSRLINSGLKHLCISIDAFSPETYRKTRNANCFERVVKNVFRFCELRDKKGADLPTIRLSFCVNPWNWQEKDAFVNYWKDKVDLVELQDYHHNNYDIQVGSPFERYMTKCAYPFCRLMVWPNGDVTLCCGYRSPDVTLGNIVKDSKVSISSLWTSSRFEKILKAFRGLEEMPKTCYNCLNSMYKLMP